MIREVPAVRIANITDAPAIADLLYEFNGEALSPDELGQRLEEAKAPETVFLGDLDGSLSGLLVLRTGPTVSPVEHWAEITELYVRSASRRRGVGTALVREALAYAQDRGCTEVHLLADPGNTVALSFYRAAGFRRDSWNMRWDLRRRRAPELAHVPKVGIMARVCTHAQALRHRSVCLE
jgi:ribosomal protein S18 acetylase RimI-like enzyme